MLELARELTDGAHPYCVTPEHIAEARRILGPNKLLAPEVMVLLQPDPARARAAARQALSFYVGLENYANNWRRLGFTDADLSGGLSDRFVDANVAWGDEGAIRKRLQAYWDAGADHVCIQSIHPTGSRTELAEEIYDLLAPAKG
jgi:probable F420-dependent oxidoreductase